MLIMAKSENKGGRPTKYKQGYCEDLIEFFDVEPYKLVTLEETKEYFTIDAKEKDLKLAASKDEDIHGPLKKKTKKTKPVANKMPTFFRFGKKIGVSYDTLKRWKKKENKLKYPGFRTAYNAAKQIQKEFIITVGMAGAAPPAFAIFTAKNVTDMRDKVETDLTSKGERINQVLVKFLDDKAKNNRDTD